MHKTLIVKGMMCPHCEAHCRESLEKVDGVVITTPARPKSS